MFDLNICWRRPFKVDLIDILRCEFTPAVSFCLGHALFTPRGLNNMQLSPEGEMNSDGYIPRREASRYRKRPCISRTFFHKIEAKNRGCSLSIHLCLEFSKTFIKLKVPRKKHKRNWERVAVVKGVFKCLSANLAVQKFLQAINFCFTQTNKHLQPVTAMRIFPPRAI